MVIRLFLALVILVTIMWYLAWYRKAPSEKRTKSLTSLLLYGIAIALIILVITGRIPWLFALVSAVIPWLNRFLMVKQTFDFFNKKQKSNTPQTTDMSIDEAYKILNLDHNSTRQNILDAHKKLIQKNHPDRGGSDYLAQQINLAKDILLKYLDNKNN